MCVKALSVKPEVSILNPYARRGCDWCGHESEYAMLMIEFTINTDHWTEYWHARCWVRWAMGHPDSTG